MMDPIRRDDELRATNLAFYKAFEAGDIEAMASVWANEAPISCVHPGWEPVVGREAVLASWVGIFRGTREIIFTLRNVQMFMVGDTAWVVLIEEIDASQQDGQRVRASSQATNVFVREPDGWKLVHHHAGPGVALPGSAPSVSRILH
jgi:uncharacterized protein (TIGR02246 family)